MDKVKCPQCGALVDEKNIRCPRCFKLLVQAGCENCKLCTGNKSCTNKKSSCC